jgi:hypothetical protein
MSLSACRSPGWKAKAGQGTTRLMGCEVSPVEAGNQRQDLLGRPAPAVDHHEVLMDRIW